MQRLPAADCLSIYTASGNCVFVIMLGTADYPPPSPLRDRFRHWPNAEGEGGGARVTQRNTVEGKYPCIVYDFFHNHASYMCNFNLFADCIVLKAFRKNVF